MVASTNLTALKKHVCLLSASEIDNLIMPLKAEGVTVFNFHKEYHDGRMLRLSNHALWTEHYFSKGYVNKQNKVPSTYLEKKLNYFIWCKQDWPEMLIDSAVNFNISNGISIVKYLDDGIEYYGFGADSNNYQIVNAFYLSHLETLENFCLSFKERAADLIQQHEQDKIIIPKLINQQRKQISLSVRQLACAQLILKGLTLKEIALKLSISPRTVEDYVNTLKCKFDCRNKTELVLKLSAEQYFFSQL